METKEGLSIQARYHQCDESQSYNIVSESTAYYLAYETTKLLRVPKFIANLMPDAWIAIEYRNCRVK